MGAGLFLILMILLVILLLAAELGIQDLNRWKANCLEKSEKRGVQAARNAPSADRTCWQRVG